MDKWIEEHIDDFTLDELQRLDGYRKERGYVAVFGSMFGLGPQYLFAQHPDFWKAVQNGVKGKVFLGLVGVMPFGIGVLASLPVKWAKDKYVKKLMHKYDPEIITNNE
mmetsp:Transcript_9920/g.14812  ORF Transcript_9920/g.14812 Transcript_9920/m.14812 type:complete len:108 (+) Transcript_9920:447-770(+)